MNYRYLILWGIVVIGLLFSVYFIGHTHMDDLMLSYKFDKVVKAATKDYIEDKEKTLPFVVTSGELIQYDYLDKLEYEDKLCNATINVKKVLFFKYFDIKYVCTTKAEE